MTDPVPDRRYRFGIFEADAATGELRRQGLRVRLHAQPFQVLLLLVERQGQLVTREEMARFLWPEGTFVDADHGLHSAINRIREALGDTAASPRFVETLARRGYRFIAPIEVLSGAEAGESIRMAAEVSEDGSRPAPGQTVESIDSSPHILASAEQLPRLSWPVTQTLFVLFQTMYLGFYVGALFNLPEIQELLSPLHRANAVFLTLIVTAAALIPVRAFVLTAALLQTPGLRSNFLRLWRFLLPFDEAWALSPFLLLHHIDFGVALACTAMLAGAPFAQRSLVLMGAGSRAPESSASAP